MLAIIRNDQGSRSRSLALAVETHHLLPHLLTSDLYLSSFRLPQRVLDLNTNIASRSAPVSLRVPAWISPQRLAHNLCIEQSDLQHAFRGTQRIRYMPGLYAVLLPWGGQSTLLACLVPVRSDRFLWGAAPVITSTHDAYFIILWTVILIKNN